MFNTTLMEPTAYRHFVQTGEFREGTMLALILQGIGTNATPARQGQFATDVHVVEMAVKDKGRVPEGWAYYQFGGSDDRRIRIDRRAAAEGAVATAVTWSMPGATTSSSSSTACLKEATPQASRQ